MKCCPYEPKLLQNIIILAHNHSDDGQEKVLFQPSKLKEINTDTSYLLKRMNQPMNPEITAITLSMPESPPKNKKRIYKDKSSISKSDSQTTPLSQTLVPDSTTKEKALRGFWKPSFEEKYAMLWLPIKTDSHVSDLTSFSGCSTNLEANWKVWNAPPNPERKNLSEILWKSSQCSQPDTMEAETTLKTRKIRIYPNPTQKALFKHCFGASRYFYNKAIREIQQRYDKKKQTFYQCETCIHCMKPKQPDSWMCEDHTKKEIPWKLNITLPSVRPVVMSSDKSVSKEESWQCVVPYDTRQMAIQDAVKAYKSATSLKSQGHISHFELKPRTKKHINQTFWITPEAITQDWRIFVRRTKDKSKLRIRKRQKKLLAEWLPKGADSYSKIQKNGDAYYLVLSGPDTKPNVPAPRECISLDPGSRTFQSGYTTDGSCYQFGFRQKEQIQKLHQRLDMLQAKRTESSPKTKGRIQKRMRGLHKKIQDIIFNLHSQTASFMAKNFQTIVLGKLDTGRILKQNHLASKTNRMLQTLSHYKFQQKLEGQCSKYNRCFVLQNESYTTKTCGLCGTMNECVGGKDVFQCEKCGLESDRDFHAARNILLKWLSESRFPTMTHVGEKSLVEATL